MRSQERVTTAAAEQGLQIDIRAFPDGTRTAADAAAAIGCDVRRASATEVQAATGYAIGGVPPLGHVTPLRCFVDDALLAYDVVWAAAGTPHHVFAVAPSELVAATGATVAALRVASPPPA